MSKELRSRVEKAIRDSGIANGKNVSCASPLIYQVAFENKDSALNCSLGTSMPLSRGHASTPQRVKKSYFSKMQHYHEFRKLLSEHDSTLENAEHVLSKKNENIVLHGEQTIVKEARTR